jgi:hypothetical protein
LTIALFNLNVRLAAIVTWMLVIFVAFTMLRILYLRAHFETIRYELTDLNLTNQALTEILRTLQRIEALLKDRAPK